VRAGFLNVGQQLVMQQPGKAFAAGWRLRRRPLLAAEGAGGVAGRPSVFGVKDDLLYFQNLVAAPLLLLACYANGEAGRGVRFFLGSGVGGELLGRQLVSLGLYAAGTHVVFAISKVRGRSPPPPARERRVCSGGGGVCCACARMCVWRGEGPNVLSPLRPLDGGWGGGGSGTGRRRRLSWCRYGASSASSFLSPSFRNPSLRCFPSPISHTHARVHIRARVPHATALHHRPVQGL
jgi:hypothetical protein